MQIVSLLSTILSIASVLLAYPMALLTALRQTRRAVDRIESDVQRLVTLTTVTFAVVIGLIILVSVQFFETAHSGIK